MLFKKFLENPEGKKRLIVAAILIGALLIGLGYGYGCWFFQSHFLPRTMINEFNCSFKSAEEVKDLMNRKAKSYALAVNTRNGGVEKISADSIGMKYKDDGYIQAELEKQNNWLWIVLTKHQLDIKVSYSMSDKKLDEAVENLKCFKDNVPPEDAKIILKNGDFQIVPETNGTMLVKDRVKIVIETAVRKGNSSVDLKECYQDPQVRENDLKDKLKALNKIKDVVITYDMGDRKETLDIEKIFKLTTDYELDSNKVRDYIKKLAKKYDTKGAKRNFVTYDDRQIEVQGGDYGWVIDQEKSADALIKAINKGKAEVITPVYQQEAKSRNANDIDFSYLEIDKENRCIVLYKDGQPILQETGIMTGNLPDGCYIAGTYEDAHEQDDLGLLWWLPFGNDLCIYSVDEETAEKINQDTETDNDDTDNDTEADDDDTDSTDTDNSDDDDTFEATDRSDEEEVDLPNGFRLLETKAQDVCKKTEKGLPIVVY